MKKSFIILLIFLMSFSSTAFGAVLPAQPQSIEENQTHEKVRVIVELTSNPAIAYAQENEVKYSDLSETTKNHLEQEAISEQAEVINALPDIQPQEHFTTVLNGFSAEVDSEQINKIENLSNVAQVYEVQEYQRPEATLDLDYSKELIGAQQAWDQSQFKGEGMVVGVIDTGIDPTHKDFVLSPTTEEALTQTGVSQLIQANNLPGKYYTEKVPYAYNYRDQNNDILDTKSTASRGMHDSGIVAANGDENNGGLKGVAPEAQVLGLKVFSNSPYTDTTTSDIYIKAIDDAIKLGADVLNINFGNPAGFVNAQAPEQIAIQRAVDSGILVAVAAGDETYSGYQYATGNPLAANPDIGVVSSPGTATNSLQVASFENEFVDLDVATFAFNGQQIKAPFLSESKVNPLDVTTKSFDIVYAGYGTIQELENLNVSGKYVLIQRGTINFVDKALNAQAKGAAGVIIYNIADGLVQMYTDPSIHIPQLFIHKTNGDLVAAALTAGQSVNVSFLGDPKIKTTSPLADTMSPFSSWGVTPNLDLKPEITAPGGKIKSTLNNNKYGVMSSTAMAAAHVAGGSALVLERVDKEFQLQNAARVQMAKNLLMNTAKPIIDITNYFRSNIPYSPRLQGSGLVQLPAALSTPVIVTNPSTNEGKVALKQLNSDQVTFTIKAKNYHSEPVSYNVGVNVQTNLAISGKLGIQPNKLDSQPLLTVPIKVNGKDNETITLAGYEERFITVQLDLTNARVLELVTDSYLPVPVQSVFPNGYFVEGFVILTDPTDTNPALSVPYVGFRGNWDQAPIIDLPIWDSTSFYKHTGMVDEFFNNLGYDWANGGYNGNKIAFSPNGDGFQDSILPSLSLLRNAKAIELNILDQSGNKIKSLQTLNNVTKNYYNAGKASSSYVFIGGKWDGKGDLTTAPEGQYYYEIRSVIDYPGASWQSLRIPVKIDVTPPNFQATLEKFTTDISLSGLTDSGSGISKVDIVLNGKTVITGHPQSENAFYRLGTLIVTDRVDVVATDYAGNRKVINVQDGDIVKPLPPIVDPVTDAQTIITGTAEAGAKVIAKVNDQIIGESTANGSRQFSIPIAKQTAGTKINVAAKDAAGNESDPTVVTVVDKTAPTAPVVNQVTDLSVTISGTAEPGAKIIAKIGSQVAGETIANATGEFEMSIMKPIAGTVFNVTATDAAGNVSTSTEVTVKDVIKPSLQLVYEVTDADTFIRGIAEAGTKVVAKIGTQVIGEATVPPSERFEIPITKQAAGTKIMVIAIDAAGNTSDRRDIMVIAAPPVIIPTPPPFFPPPVVIPIVDTTPPVAPVVSEVKENDVILKGTTEAGAKVVAKISDQNVGETTANAEGKFEITIEKQKAGTKIVVTATDAAGNTSPATEVIVLELDKTAPASPTVNGVSDADTMITGSAEAGAKAVAKVNGQAIGQTTVDKDSKFDIRISKLTAGTKIVVTVIDTAGNVSGGTEVIVSDGTAPSAPIVGVVKDFSRKISGKAEAGTSITVRVGSKILGYATVNKNGDFAVIIKAQKAGTVISVFAADEVGHVSNPTKVTVMDGTPPAIPILDKVTSNSTKVTGKAEANATVYVKIGNKVIGKATVNKDGKFTVKIAKQKAGAKLTVIAVDKEENESVTALVTVKK